MAGTSPPLPPRVYAEALLVPQGGLPMIRAILLALVLVAGLSVAPAHAATTRVTLYATASPDPVAAWVDLGATPINVRVLGSDYALIVVDTVAPSTFDADATILGNGSETGRDFTAPGQHVYARALNNQTRVAVTPTGAGGGGAASTTAASGIAPTSTQSSALVAKASPGTLYGYNATAGATPGFVALLNATAAPAASAAITPLECSAIPANGTFRARQDIPDRYTAGIVLVFTSSCSTFTAVTPAVMSAVVQ